MAALVYSRRWEMPVTQQSLPPLDEPTPSPEPSIDFRKHLEEGIEITPAMMAELRECIPTVAGSRPHSSVIEMSYDNYHVFRLKNYPQIVFKMALYDGQNAHERFENMIKATEVCFRHKLNRLIVPKAKKIEVSSEGRKYYLIAEQWIKLRYEDKPHILHPDRLKETTRQLAMFIANTGFYDVKPANIPICDSDDYDWSIVLVDIETCRLDIKHITAGFVGTWNGSCGLLKCVSRDQIPVVQRIAQEAGAQITDGNLAYAYSKLDEDESYIARKTEANRK